MNIHGEFMVTMCTTSSDVCWIFGASKDSFWIARLQVGAFFDLFVGENVPMHSWMSSKRFALQHDLRLKGGIGTLRRTTDKHLEGRHPVGLVLAMGCA